MSNRQMSFPRAAARRWLWALCLYICLSFPALRAAANEPTLVAGFEVEVHVHAVSAYDALWETLPDQIAKIRAGIGREDVLLSGEIHVVSNINEYLRERGRGGNAPYWAQAIAMPSQQLIVLRVPDPQLERTLAHELSHLAVHEAAGGEHVPRWFLEGFAMLQAEEFSIERALKISAAALFDNTLDFEALDTRFPPHQLSASLAYAQSFHMVQTLMDDYGSEVVGAWFLAISQGTPWRDGFRSVFGIGFHTVADVWEDSVRVWYAWIPSIISVSTIWLMVAFLAWWALKRARRRRMTRLEAMEAFERGLYPPDPDDELFR